ncbi:MAG: PKD domain-containing protein [Dehalococcoidia bacterium]|jgi:PKD repeat protein
MTLTVDFDSLPRTFYMPTGGSVVVRFIDKSVTTNGVVNSWAWTFGDTGTASTQNPSHTYTAAGTYDVSLTCNDSGGTGATAVTKTAWIKIEAGTFTPPAQNTAFRNITIFVYERSSEAAPKGTCICRAKTAACNLFFTNLQVQGYITKAGKATFDVTNAGGGTADEIDLFESGTVGRYKNVAIIAGYDVIWSGKMTIANKELMSQPSTTPQKAMYHCEAYSDIKKLADWNIIAANQSTQVGKSAGQLAALICATNSGEPDFIGTRGGFIDPSGTALQMTLSDTDKLTAFSTLTGATDYDWRTRMETMLFQYATFNGTNLTTITSAGLTTNALIGSWILFPTTNYLLSGTSTPNYSGVLAWGRITANDATTITAAVSGAATVPLATDKCLIVQVPLLDVSSDLAETTAVRSFTNNLNVVKFANSDNKDDLFTKAIVKGKDTVTGKTEAVSVAAVTLFDSSKMVFGHSTIITYRTMGYVAGYEEGAADAGASSYIYLSGWGWANPSVSSFGVWYALAVTPTTGGSYGAGNQFKNPTEMTWQGQKVTQITYNASALSAAWKTVGSMAFYYYSNGTVYGMPIYVKSYSDIDWSTGAMSGQPQLKVGFELYTIYGTTTTSAGTDAVYGPYILHYPPVGSNIPYPHGPGCIIWRNSYYSETSPVAGSAVAVNGIINKTIQSDEGNTKGDFEVMAANALIQGSQYYQKSTMSVSYYQFTANRVRDGVQLTGPAMIREGQRIAIVPATGVTAISRQVVGWEFDASTMTFKLTLGDYIKDIYNTINANTAATQKALI